MCAASAAIFNPNVSKITAISIDEMKALWRAGQDVAAKTSTAITAAAEAVSKALEGPEQFSDDTLTSPTAVAFEKVDGAPSVVAHAVARSRSWSKVHRCAW